MISARNDRQLLSCQEVQEIISIVTAFETHFQNTLVSDEVVNTALSGRRLFDNALSSLEIKGETQLHRLQEVQSKLLKKALLLRALNNRILGLAQDLEKVRASVNIRTQNVFENARHRQVDINNLVECARQLERASTYHGSFFNVSRGNIGQKIFGLNTFLLIGLMAFIALFSPKHTSSLRKNEASGNSEDIIGLVSLLIVFCLSYAGYNEYKNHQMQRNLKGEIKALLNRLRKRGSLPEIISVQGFFNPGSNIWDSYSHLYAEDTESPSNTLRSVVVLRSGYVP